MVFAFSLLGTQHERGSAFVAFKMALNANVVLLLLYVEER